MNYLADIIGIINLFFLIILEKSFSMIDFNICYSIYQQLCQKSSSRNLIVLIKLKIYGVIPMGCYMNKKKASNLLLYLKQELLAKNCYTYKLLILRIIYRISY